MKLKWNRRTFLGSLGAATAWLGSGGRAFAWTSPRALKLSGFGETGNVYDELGVTTVINGQGTMTMLGGSLPRPEVEAAMALAAQHFVSIPELEVAAGKKIAEMLKLPDGYTALVTSGAAGAMQSGLAGILTADNEQYIQQLPDLTGLKSEVIIQKSHRNPFDHQLRGTGAKLIEIETREELHNAVNQKTAMMHFTNFANAAGRIKVEEWVKLARQYNIPAMIDAAADTPPVSHLWDYANMGYDLITFSGGKAIRGPQCAGLLIGRKELVGYALLNNSPYEDTLGRGQKVGKEEIVGMVKALEVYLKEDHDALTQEWWKRLDTVAKQITKVDGVSTAYYVPDIANHVPTMQINWDPRRIGMTPREASDALRKSKPAIVLGRTEIGLEMNSFMLQPGEDQIIGERLVQVFRAHAA
ncbi:MAG TPA: aminotransferase class V-fold PLP-dependent enzyme [Candidatus Limnocylindrales bacterium]|nr:aminotransferase class V-fold PLP-dependent enzyme [Candidatus Limnocylindrales bacterium]